jgi:HEAT repeat protein
MTKMFDFLKRSPSSSIDKLVKRLTETAGEDGPRIEAAEKLCDMDTPEAIYALAKRFTMSSKVITQDIEEKRMVVRMMVDKGDAAVEPLMRFLKSHHQVEWPVRALEEILPQEELAARLVAILEEVALNPFTAAEHRASLIKAVHGHVTPEIAKTLMKSLKDDDDDVAIAAIQALAETGEAVREALLEAFVEADGRPRIRTAIAEVFVQREWPVKGFRPTVENVLPDGFHLTAKGLIQRKNSESRI